MVYIYKDQLTEETTALILSKVKELGWNGEHIEKCGYTWAAITTYGDEVKGLWNLDAYSIDPTSFLHEAISLDLIHFIAKMGELAKENEQILNS